MCHYYQDNRFHCGNKTWATHRNPYPLWWRACFSFAALCGWTHIDFQAFPCFGDGLWACFLSLCLSTPTPHLHSLMGDGFAISNSELHFGYTETLQRKNKKLPAIRGQMRTGNLWCPPLQEPLLLPCCLSTLKAGDQTWHYSGIIFAAGFWENTFSLQSFEDPGATQRLPGPCSGIRKWTNRPQTFLAIMWLVNHLPPWATLSPS